jgi:hypothetical protein
LDGRNPLDPRIKRAHESSGLGCAVKRHEPVGDDGPHTDRQGISPTHAGFLALSSNGFAQRLDGAGIPRRIRARADLGHALGAAQLLELQRFVLHGKFVSPLAFAVDPFQDLRRQTKGPAEEAAQ